MIAKKKNQDAAATARPPYTGFVRFDGTSVEELKVLQKLLPNDGSHPYKESPYEIGENLAPHTSYMDKYTMELPHLHNSESGNETTYVAIQNLIHSIFSQSHVDTRINIRFSKDTRGRYMYSEELAKILVEIEQEV